jgi:hypothetical protein
MGFLSTIIVVDDILKSKQSTYLRKKLKMQGLHLFIKSVNSRGDKMYSVFMIMIIT